MALTKRGPADSCWRIFHQLREKLSTRHGQHGGHTAVDSGMAWPVDTSPVACMGYFSELRFLIREVERTSP